VSSITRDFWCSLISVGMGALRSSPAMSNPAGGGAVGPS
jgi:hypothetical protein